MALPKPNLYPAFNIVRLSHVELAVTDLAKSRAFYVDTLGLQVTDETSGAIYLRALEERGHHCIVLRKATAPEARDLGFKVYSDEDLDKAAHFFKGKELPVEWVERPYQSRTFRTRDPHARGGTRTANRGLGRGATLAEAIGRRYSPCLILAPLPR